MGSGQSLDPVTLKWEQRTDEWDDLGQGEGMPVPVPVPLSYEAKQQKLLLNAGRRVGTMGLPRTLTSTTAGSVHV